MKSKEFIPEKFNKAVFQRGFEQTKPFKHFTLVAKHGDLPYIPGKKARVSDQFHIEAYDGKTRIAWVNFQVINDKLEAIDVVVNDDYRRGGIATAMYKFATELGNDVQSSSMQTDAGKAFWQGKKAMSANESIITELGNAPAQYKPMSPKMGRKGFENQDLDLQVIFNIKGEYVLSIDFFVGGRFDITNGGNAIKILSTVVGIIKNELPGILAEEPGIGVIRFTSDADESSRIKLYDRAAPTISKILGPNWQFLSKTAPNPYADHDIKTYSWKRMRNASQ